MKVSTNTGMRTETLRAGSPFTCGLLILGFVLAAIGSAKSQTSCAGGPHPLYSQNAVMLDGAVDHPVRVTSPDGLKRVQVKTVMDDPKMPGGWRMDLTITFAKRTFRSRLIGFNGELAWSPDSKAIAITVTTGGGGIGSKVYVFFVEPTGIQRIDVSKPIEEHFGHPVKCEIRVAPNTGFIGWQKDSSTLLVAAEVVPVSICQCSGAYRVYEVKLPSATIVGTMTQTQAEKSLLRSLGCELRGANDSCSLDAHKR